MNMLYSREMILDAEHGRVGCWTMLDIMNHMAKQSHFELAEMFNQ